MISDAYCASVAQHQEPLHIPSQAPRKRSAKYRYLAGFCGTLGVAGLAWALSPPKLQEQPTTPNPHHRPLEPSITFPNTHPLSPTVPPDFPLAPIKSPRPPLAQKSTEFSQSVYKIRLGIITPQDIATLPDDQRTRFTTSKNEAFKVFLKQFNRIDQRSARHDFIVHQLILGNMSGFFLKEWLEQFASDHHPAPDTAQKLLAHLKTKDQLDRYQQLDNLLRDLNNPIAQFFKPMQDPQGDMTGSLRYQQTTTFKTVPLVANAAEEILAAAFNYRLRNSFKRQIEMWPEFTTAKTPEKLEESLQTLLGVPPFAFKDALLSELNKRDPSLKPLWEETPKITYLTPFLSD